MTTEPMYSSQSTRWDCDCPPGRDVRLDGHDDDCPEHPRTEETL